MRHSGLSYDMKSRQSCLEVFIKDWDPVVDHELALCHILSQIFYARQIHAVAGGEEDMVYREPVTSIKSCFDRTL